MPVKATTENRTLNDGAVGFKCPQAYPEWTLQEQADASGVPPEVLLQYIMADPTANEDCLFLDVSVPRDVFDKHAKDRDEHPNDNAHSLGKCMVYKKLIKY